MTNYELSCVILAVILAVVMIPKLVALMLLVGDIILEEIFDIELKEIIKDSRKE